MNHRKNWKQFIGILSVIVIAVSSFPANVIAEGDDKESVVQDQGEGTQTTPDNENPVNGDTENNDNNTDTGSNTQNTDSNGNPETQDTTQPGGSAGEKSDTETNDPVPVQTVSVDVKAAGSGTAVIGKNGENDSLTLTADVGEHEGTYSISWTGTEGLSFENIGADSAKVSGSKAGPAKVTATVKDQNGKTMGSGTMDLEVWTDRVIEAKVFTETPNGNSKATGRAFVGESLKWTITSSNDGSIETDGYSFRWMKKDGREFKNIKQAVDASYTPAETGIYKVKVSRAGGDYFNAFEAESEEITVEKTPAEVEWTSASKKYLKGRKKVNYTGTSTVMLTDSVEGNTYKNDALSVSINKTAFNIDSDAVGTYTIYPANGLDTNKYDVTDKGAEIKIVSTELSVSVKLSDKQFDNTEELPDDTEISVTFKRQELTDAGLSQDTALVHKDGSDLTADDFILASAGDIDQDTETEVSLKDGVELAVKTSEGISTGYTPNVTVQKITVRKNDWSLDQVGSLKDAEGTVYTDTEGCVWIRTEGDSTEVEISAEEGYVLSDALEGIYGSTVSASIGADHSFVIYARNEKGHTAKISYVAEAVDTDAPYVDLEKSSYVLFDNKNRSNLYAVSDEGCGIRDIAYIVSDADIEPDYTKDSDAWTHVSPDEDQEGKTKLELTVPTFGYVYFYVEDQLGNHQISKLHMLVLEDGRPSVTLSAQDENLAGARISFNAEDIGSGSKTPSGISAVVFSLKDAEGNKVDDKVTYQMEEKEGYVQSGSRIGHTEAPAAMEELPSYTTAEGDVIISTNGLEGTYTLTATAMDFCGNISEEVSTELVFDTKAPVITVSMENGNEVKGTWYYRRSNCGMAVKFEDLNLTSGVEYRAVVSDEKGTAIEKTITEEELSDGTSSAELRFSSAEIAALSEGKITVIADAQDGNGNAAEEVAGNGVSVNGLTAQFVLDMTAPLIVDVQWDKYLTEYNSKEDRAFIAGHNRVTDIYISDANIDGSMLKGSSTKGKVTFRTEEWDRGVKASFALSYSIIYGTKYGYLKLDGTDYAGNILQVSPDYRPERKVTSWKNTETGATTDMEYEIVSDEPKASIIYKNGSEDLDKRHVYDNDAYFNSPDACAIVTLSEVTEQDYPYIFAALVPSGTDPETAELQPFTSDTMRFTLPSDGEFSLLIKGTNVGLASLTVNEQNLTGGDEFSETLAAKDTVYASHYRLIRDTKAPAVTLSITPGEETAHTELNSQYGSRYYFNKSFTFTATVRDENVDAQAGTVHALQAVSVDYEDASAVTFESIDSYKAELAATVSPLPLPLLRTTVFRSQISDDGVYAFTVYGEDKAGNALVLGSQKYAAGTMAIDQKNCNDKEADISEIVVLDTIAPSGRISVSAEENTVYEMSSDGQASVVKPYINKKEVQILAAVDDTEKTPAKISFKVNEKNKDAAQAVESSGFKVGQSLSSLARASQVFTVSDLVITDLAGNASVPTPKSRKLYLDMDIPQSEYGDAIAPLITIAAENNSSYGEAGTPLFNGYEDPVFSVKVTDPYAPSDTENGDEAFSSSGLSQVSWKLVNTVSGKELISSTDLYKYAGTFYPTAEEAANEDYRYVVDEKVTISKDSYNYNTLKLVVSASDNAGNTFDEEYAFGIDSTGPEVEVSFDNNKGVSGNYFAGKRTAVVKVKERNFDPDRLQILVTGDGEGSSADNAGSVVIPDSWVYKAGGGRGDDDTYTKTIVFENDGHYTLHVYSSGFGMDKAEDHVGNLGSVTYKGVAPNDFYIDTMGPEIKFVMSLTDDEKDSDGSYYYRADNCDVQVIFSDHGRNLGLSDGSVETYAISIDGANERKFTDFGNGQSSVILSYSKDELAKTRIVEDGNHTITITAVDASGNRTTKVMEESQGAVFKEGSNPGPSASFVLDTVNPVITGISTDASAGNNSGMSDLSVYADTGCAYYNRDVKIKVDIEDRFAISDYFSGSMKAEKGDDIVPSISEVQDGIQAVFSLKADSTYSNLILKGHDKAGNTLILADDYVHENCDTLAAVEGQIEALYGKVIDTVNPVVTIDYVSEDNANMYSGETEGKESAYYNNDITVRISISDNYDLDGKKLTAGPEASAGSISIPDNTRKFSCEDVVITEEGRYSYTCSGTDRALNKTKVREMIPKTDADSSVKYLPEEETSEYTAKYELILDKTAPEFVFEIKTEAANKELSTVGSRYYFNAPYIATMTVTDVNFDAERIELKKGSFSGASYNSSEVVVDSFKESITSDTNVYTDNADSTNGVFRYVMFGSDKAGNALIPASQANLDGTFTSAVDADTEKERGSLEAVADASSHIVVDTVDPYGKFRISKTEGSERYYEMDTKNQVSFAEPYRSETEAYIAFSVDTAVEHSPVKISYTINSTGGENQSGTFGSDKFVYNASASKRQSGEQIFRVSSYILTDLAGNSVSSSSPNSIYLDVKAPTEDQLAPTINISTSAKPECRDGNGQPLFNKDVPLHIVVKDPNAASSSSGLAEITYELSVYSNNKEIRKETKAIHAASEKKYNQSYSDAVLDYVLDTNSISVSSKDHNFNDLRVVIRAFDNAGNSSTREYRFGIDITKPTIKVDYDNNSAQNGKYFKANRVATVIVQERNFDASLIKITTEGGASISGWSHNRANDSNGDGDTWVCKITYAKDGNYHLTLAGSDMLGWNADSIAYNGTAPRDFVIDKTAPKLAVSYDNNSVQNGKYYKDPRTATLTVTDVNFNGANAIKVGASGGGAAPGVRFNGKTAVLPFRTDGNYTISGTVTDMAGNISNVLNEAEFVIDQVAPEISLTGVEDLSANNVPLNIILKMVDTNYNPAGFEPVLKGTNHGKVAINGEPKYVEDGITYVLDTINKDDYYELNYIATDLAGNSSDMSVSFSENQNGTSFKFVQEEYNGKSTNQSFNPEFILNNIDEITILSVTLNGKETPYTFKKDHLVLNTKTDTDGKYTITIDTRDAAGNISSMDPVEFQIDTKAPVLTVDGLNNKSKYYFEEFNLTFYHDNPIDDFSVIRMNGVDLDKSQYTINDDGSITIHIGQYQDYDFEIQVADAAGNVSDLGNIRFTMTRNPFIRWYTNTPVFLLSLVILTAIIVWFILFWKRRKDEEEEEENQASKA